MHHLLIDEQQFQKDVASALDAYVAQEWGGTVTPNQLDQSYRKLGKGRCYDVLKRLAESEILLLELKITHDGQTLPSFNLRQFRVNIALENARIPVHYGYNLVDDYARQNDPYLHTDTKSSFPAIPVVQEKGAVNWT